MSNITSLPLQVPWRFSTTSLALILFIVQPLTAQLYTPHELVKARTATSASYLTPDEQEILFLINLARQDGSAFVDSFIAPHIDEWALDPESNGYLISLLADLRKVKSLRPLQPNEPLANAAMFHATDLAVANLMSHTSSDGTPYSVRIQRFTPAEYASEVISSSYYKPLDIVMQLLIDSNVPDLGHRRALLNPLLTYAGPALGPHPRFGHIAVIELSAPAAAYVLKD